MPASLHIPVLRNEVLEYLQPRPGQIVVDGTLGGGGHARALAERVAPNGFVLALDRDPHALAAAEQTLAGLPIKVAQANFCDLPEVLRSLQLPAVDGVLLDVGLSSDQLADATRGFSFDARGTLDLRFDPTEGEPAWQLLARIREEPLADLIYEYGEERFSRRIARKIVEVRRREPIRTADQLARLVRSCLPRGPRHQIDPATRTFQALRIAVNDELGSLERALDRIPACLHPQGRFVVISFHSLEDRLVKEAFRSDPRLVRLCNKPVRPSELECTDNPRSRSAKLRAAARQA
ncbi:MAG: 16S rRNA (cytosine(1402)-N(4))-methyltransferase RsmH [Pirellulaceae bacterium]|jgi:16S rRNA (cytosine1402-N4)-methyltransferase|nr:16S rRNA (cytosine(1402)-N(4))-methyltransferase RsmH [Pirellulaceae bacterium]MCU0978126.1 16S rRNA (cytosine(1402)-N(4))-methyltransferase RsmH [Pirellulaceae bacterium]